MGKEAKKKRFKDIDAYHEYVRKEKARYRNSTGSNRYPRREWDFVEDALVLKHDIPDRKLSEILKRSVLAIQVRRSRLKNWSA